MEGSSVVAERFEIEREAGAGGMGTVFRAIDRQTAEPVALKILRASGAPDIERFYREASVLADLTHPGIVRYVAHGFTAEGSPYLAMEWLEGEDLRDRLDRGALSIGDVLTLGSRVSEALGVAHARGAIHRDIKPSNIFLQRGDLTRVKVIDFGIVRVGWFGGEATRTGSVIGTPGYMAPEQARGERQLSPAADVFALGCVLFECLTGRPAFAGGTLMAVLAKVILEESPRARELAPHVPERLDELVGVMLAKLPSARPQDGGAVARALAGLEHAVSIAGPPAPAVALTPAERRLISLVLAKPPGEQVEWPATLAATPVEEEGPFAPVRRVVEGHGALLERLADGSLIATLAGTGSATDQSARAARMALAMRVWLKGWRMVLATGLGHVSARRPVGEAVDRATALVSTPGFIAVDDLTASLLDASFDVARDDRGIHLRGEREIVESVRTLLGRPTPCVGRERERSSLLGVFEECAAASVARAVLVTGPAGIGKSRLRYELLREIRARAEVLLARGDSLRAGAPFGMIAPALCRSFGLRGGEPLSTRREKVRERVAARVGPADLERVAEFLGELAGVPMQESLALRAARQDSLLMGDQIRRAFVDFVAAECAVRPLVIVLEDLHFGDLPTVRLVDAALQRASDLPLLVLALARPEVREVFPRLWPERHVLDLWLGGLGRRASERLVRAVLGDTVSSERVGSIATRGAGSPLYLEELIRAEAEGSGERTPASLLAILQARLEGLPDEARQVLRAASVFGQVFWGGGVVALVGGTFETQGAILSDLAQRELLVKRVGSRFPGEVEYVFRHDVVREASLATLTDTDRSTGHVAAAEWLERAGEQDSSVLAGHFERGGRKDRAAACFLAAARQALQANDIEAALARAERGVACGTEGDLLGALRLTQAEAHCWQGQSAEALRRSLEALEQLPRASTPWYQAAGVTAQASGRLGDLDHLRAAAEAVRQSWPGRPRDGSAAIAATHASVMLAYVGSMSEAEALLALALEDALPLVDQRPAVAGHLLAAGASVAAAAGDVSAHLRLFDEACAHFEAVGDLRNACKLRTNVGCARVELGDYRGAEQLLRDALAQAARLGLSYLTAQAMSNLGLALARQGSLDEGHALELRAIEAFSTQGDRRQEGVCRLHLATILALRGDLAGSEREARIVAGGPEALPALRAHALSMLARAQLPQGRTTEALSAAREAMSLLERLGGVEEGEAIVRLSLTEALEAAGEHAEAGRAAAEARDRLLRRAAKIRDRTLRESFLTRIPENARTLGLADRLGV